MTRVLVTGAAGSIGAPLTAALEADGFDVLATDRDDLDVLNETQVRAAIGGFKPTLIYHLAADKHAPDGELHPYQVCHLNVEGTLNVLRHAAGARVVVASTCKACDPETAYGASKLVAERMTLNAGGVVARLYNVRETSGNVFRLWERLPLADPVPWTDCWRYFISLEDAVSLCVRAAGLPSGRYTVDPGAAVHMRDEAARLYPGRELVEAPRRRGDRAAEPLHAASETLEPFEGLLHIVSPHDPAVEYAAAA